MIDKIKTRPLLGVTDQTTIGDESIGKMQKV